MKHQQDLIFNSDVPSYVISTQEDRLKERETKKKASIPVPPKKSEKFLQKVGVYQKAGGSSLLLKTQKEVTNYRMSSDEEEVITKDTFKETRRYC